MKIVLNGTPEELREFLNINDSLCLNKSIVSGGIGRFYSEIVDDEVTISNYEDILKSLPDAPGVNKETFQYDHIRDTGYFGRLSSEKFISYDGLCEVTNFEKGKLMAEDMGWLVFYFKGDILYIPQHPIRYNISWNDINNAGLVNSSKVIQIEDLDFEISLITGARSNPVDDIKWSDADSEGEQLIDIGHGSIWNELIYRVHEDIPGTTDAGMNASGGPQHGDNWDNLTDEDLNINWAKCSNGTASWMQETSSSAVTYRVYRGYHRLADWDRFTASHASTHYGWRPLLRLKTKNR